MYSDNFTINHVILGTSAYKYIVYQSDLIKLLLPFTREATIDAHLI